MLHLSGIKWRFICFNNFSTSFLQCYSNFCAHFFLPIHIIIIESDDFLSERITSSDIYVQTLYNLHISKHSMACHSSEILCANTANGIKWFSHWQWFSNLKLYKQCMNVHLHEFMDYKNVGAKVQYWIDFHSSTPYIELIPPHTFDLYERYVLDFYIIIKSSFHWFVYIDNGVYSSRIVFSLIQACCRSLSFHSLQPIACFYLALTTTSSSLFVLISLLWLQWSVFVYEWTNKFLNEKFMYGHWLWCSMVFRHKWWNHLNQIVITKLIEIWVHNKQWEQSENHFMYSTAIRDTNIDN